MNRDSSHTHLTQYTHTHTQKQRHGIDVFRFGEVLMTSGLVLMDEVRWISFHSGYDFGYLLKLLTWYVCVCVVCVCVSVYLTEICWGCVSLSLAAALACIHRLICISSPQSIHTHTYTQPSPPRGREWVFRPLADVFSMLLRHQVHDDGLSGPPWGAAEDCGGERYSYTHTHKHPHTSYPQSDFFLTASLSHLHPPPLPPSSLFLSQIFTQTQTQTHTGPERATHRPHAPSRERLPPHFPNLLQARLCLLLRCRKAR